MSSGARVVDSITTSSGSHAYVVPDDQLSMGASLGNSTSWLTAKGNGYPQAFFDVRAGKRVTWNSIVRYGSQDFHFVNPFGLSPGADPHRHAPWIKCFTPLSQARTGTFELRPACVDHRFELQGRLDVVESLFVPKYDVSGDPSCFYLSVALTNHSPERQTIACVLSTKLKPEVDPSQITERTFTARWDQRAGALLVASEEQPNWVRVFGADRRPTVYGATLDHGRADDPVLMSPLDCDVSAVGSLVAEIQVDVTLDPGAQQRFSFFVGFDDGGAEKALALIDRHRDGQLALEKTFAFFERAVQTSRVLCPEPAINQGVLWSKVNMLRVMIDQPATGLGFTNEPGVSSNVVGRDAGWFVYGCDYLEPEFSRAVIRRFAACQYPDGKIPEYYNGLTGAVEDYGLNINDDTPLVVLAAVHHVYATGDDEFGREIYPMVRRAVDYILKQRDERGLVFCTARGENVWGICSWRNVIPNYTLSGAVTEINSECYAAIRVAYRLAKRLGLADDAAAFEAQATALKLAINTHLLNENTHLYYLAHDVDGVARTDVTADLVFPVMFRVADDATSLEIMRRLQAEDFWTEAGLRTVPRGNPDYHPSKEVGLLGGVWPGVNFWYAFAMARHDRTSMMRALRDSYGHYTSDPKTNWTVPGQFSEWFDGESLTNRGMRLSPWEPPRYLWAALEGMCGLNLLHYRHYDPLIPEEWEWLAMGNVPLLGGRLSWFAARIGERLEFFSAGASAPRDPRRHYREDISASVLCLNEHAQTIGLEKRGEVLICVGNTSRFPITVPVAIREHLEVKQRYNVQTADRFGWTAAEDVTAEKLSKFALRIDAKGFKLLKLTRAP